jgi:hypothetical protein
MSPLFITLENNKHLMIIPDTQAHLDGHEVITYMYSIYADHKDGLSSGVRTPKERLRIPGSAIMR